LPIRLKPPGNLIDWLAPDLAGSGRLPDFDYFAYRERSYSAEPFGKQKGS
jgi:hypothetical protein